MDWEQVAAIGMAFSAGLVLAFLAFLGFAVFVVGDDAEPDTLTDIEHRIAGR